MIPLLALPAAAAAESPCRPPDPAAGDDPCAPLLLDDGRRLLVAPLRPRDAAAIQAFVTALSPGSRYRRFHVGIPRLPPALLAHLAGIDPLQQRAREVRAQAHAAGAAAARRIQACKGLEHPLQLVLGDARPMVRDDDAGHAIVGVDGDADPGGVADDQATHHVQ